MNAMTFELRSTLTCPECGGRTTETMPTDACQYFFACRCCSAVRKPNAGVFCFFCSPAAFPCPPVQEARANGGAPSCCSAASG